LLEAEDVGDQQQGRKRLPSINLLEWDRTWF
jgi:hypothetical protein